MRLAVLLVGLVVAVASVAAGPVRAQTMWVQIEAQPSLAEGEARARAYSGVFPNVAGFAMTTGWYAIAIGPFEGDEATRQLDLLRGERLIPGDSYLTDGSRFRQQFWPVGANGLVPPVLSETAPPATEDTPGTAAADEGLTVLPAPYPDETPAEARRSEALLGADERKLLQEALQWDRHYAGAIDGAFGSGTRRSMAEWQSAQGYEPTGILTTAQRRELTEGYATERAALGLETVAEPEAGIEVTLPLALVEFDGYQPPFVRYREKDGSGIRVLLISQQGEQSTLYGLYDIMQTLEIVPLEGERSLGRTNFVLTGANDDLQSYTQAELKGGLVKGFTLAWKPEDAERAARILEAMKTSFRPVGDRALDEGLGQPLAEDRADLMSGLEVRRPERSRSGFWLDGAGLVATTGEVIRQCGRVTLDGTTEADVVFDDAALGLAVLKPRTALAPRAHARLRDAGRINSEIAVSGYSYEDALDAPVMSFGTLADTRGLDGEATLSRLAVTTLAGDAGGPVLDGSGQVIGMLLPRASADGRVLPGDVGFALSAAAIREALAAQGMASAEPAAETPETRGALAPEDLTRLGRDLTVLVSCWN